MKSIRCLPTNGARLARPVTISAKNSAKSKKRSTACMDSSPLWRPTATPSKFNRFPLYVWRRSPVIGHHRVQMTNDESQGNDKNRIDAGNLTDVRDHRTDIGVMIRRRFDRNRSLLHLELPGPGLGVLFQLAAYLLLKVGVAAAEGPGNCAAYAFNAFDRRVAGAPRDILRFRDRPGAGVPGLFEAAANARSDLLRAAVGGVAGPRRGVFDFVTDL